MTSNEIISNLEKMVSNEELLKDEPEATTISTIAIQSGTTRAIIAVLQSGHLINLRIIEMTPKLSSIARNVPDSETLLQRHEEVLEKLKNKQTPVEQMLLQADKIGPTKNPVLYKAMAASLGTAWRDVNLTLDLRKQILQKVVSFHTNRVVCLDYFAKVCEDKKQVLVTYRYAVEDGRRLIEKLQEVATEEPEDASYSIGLVHIWLDELQYQRFRWQANLKTIGTKERHKLVTSEYERIIQEIETQFQNGGNLDELRSRLLHVSSSVDRSELPDSKKTHLQHIIFNLIERITIVMELEEEIRTFLSTMTVLDEPTFKQAYEEKLKLIETFDLKNIDDLKTKLEKRLESRKNYEKCLENPLHYSDEEIPGLINLDSDLDITSALERIRNAKNKLGSFIYLNLEEEMNDVEMKYANLSNSAKKVADILVLKEKVDGIEDAAKHSYEDPNDSSAMLSKCSHFRDLLTREETVAKFLAENNILDSNKFKERYSDMLSSELCRQSTLRDCVATRFEIQGKYDAMVENPTAFSEGHIETICNWDPTLDTIAAYEKLRLLRMKAMEDDANVELQNLKAIEAAQKSRSEEIERQRLQDEAAKRELRETQLKRQVEEAKLKRKQEEDERKREELVAELKRKQKEDERQREELEAELKRLQETAELQRQQEELQAQLQCQQEEIEREAERKRQMEEAEKTRLQETAELRRQQAEAELRRRQEEAELRRQQAEAELRRRQEEAELRRQLEEAESRRQQEEAELRRQQEEAEWNRLKAEAELREQLEAAERKRQQAEAELRAQLETAERNRQQAEIERQDAERKRQEAEAELQRQLELAEKNQQQAEIKRQETERKQQQAEIERKQAEEAERHRLVALELQRQLDFEVENERLGELRRANLERERQNKELEARLQNELQLRQQELKELESQRQEALELRQRAEFELQQAEEERKLEQQRHEERKDKKRLEKQRQVELERQHEAKLRKQIQAEIEAKERHEAELKRKALEAQKLREQHLDQLFNTLDFPLPENFDTARNDLNDFQRFEAIVEQMDNPPLELIEKMNEKKNQIIRCLQFYELIQKEDRISYFHEITKLEYELFKDNTISDQIRKELQVQPNDTCPENGLRHSFTENPNLNTYVGPSGDYFSSVSDTEVQTIFEHSTMQTQTAERDARIFANCETQTLMTKSPEPIVLFMQEPAKILSTVESQTPTLADNQPSATTTATSPLPDDTAKDTGSMYTIPLKPESPAKLFLTTESQTEEGKPGTEIFSKRQLYTQNKSDFFYETTRGDNEPKPALLDSITQTYEPSPTLLRNSEVQTQLPGSIQNPQVSANLPEGSVAKVQPVAEKCLKPDVKADEDAKSSTRRPVKDFVTSLNARIVNENAPIPQPRGSQKGKSEEPLKAPDSNRLFEFLNQTRNFEPMTSTVTTKRQFENYEEVVTRQLSYPLSPPLKPFTAGTPDENRVEFETTHAHTLPRRKVKDYKKIFEQPSIEVKSQSTEPRNVPIQVEFPKGKVGQYRQLFESVDSSPPPFSPYQISSIRQTAKYDSISKNYESNYTEHVSCHGVDSPMSPIGSPFLSFQDSRPESAASNPFGGPRRPTKFVPVKFAESDYESDYESFKIEPIWIPPSTRNNRPMSAYEFRPANSYTKTWDDARPKSTTTEKPGPSHSSIAKPIAVKKPIPPPKPKKKTQADKVTTDQMIFKMAEPITDSLQKHKQLTTTLTKTEECKFYLRPIESPVNYDEELQVRRSLSPTRYVSVTGTPIHFSRAGTAPPQVGESYNKDTYREERTWQSFDRDKSSSLEFAHYVNNLESRSDRNVTQLQQSFESSSGQGTTDDGPIVSGVERQIKILKEDVNK